MNCNRRTLKRHGRRGDRQDRSGTHALRSRQKNGASAQNLHDMLGLGSYETAWAWLHKLRRAMVRPDRELLSGVVEVDESFVGGRATAQQGASTDKVPVMIAVENVDQAVSDSKCIVVQPLSYPLPDWHSRVAYTQQTLVR